MTLTSWDTMSSSSSDDCDGFVERIKPFLSKCSSDVQRIVYQELSVVKELFGRRKDSLWEIPSFVDTYMTIFGRRGSSSPPQPGLEDTSSSTTWSWMRNFVTDYRSILSQCYNPITTTNELMTTNFVALEDLQKAHATGRTQVLSKLSQYCQQVGYLTAEEGEERKNSLISRLNREYSWIWAVNTERYQRTVNQRLHEEFEIGRYNLESMYPFDETKVHMSNAMRESIEGEIIRRVDSFEKTFATFGDAILKYVAGMTVELRSKLEDVGSSLIKQNSQFLAECANSSLVSYNESMKLFLETKSNNDDAAEIQEEHERLKTAILQEWEEETFGSDPEYSAYLDKLKQNMDKNFYRMWDVPKKCALDWRAQINERMKALMEANGAPYGADDQFLEGVPEVLAQMKEWFRETVEGDKLSLAETVLSEEEVDITMKQTEGPEKSQEFLGDIKVADANNTNLLELEPCSRPNSEFAGPGPGPELFKEEVVAFQMGKDPFKEEQQITVQSTEYEVVAGMPSPECTNMVETINNMMEVYTCTNSNSDLALASIPCHTPPENDTRRYNGTLEGMERATGLKLKAVRNEAHASATSTQSLSPIKIRIKKRKIHDRGHITTEYSICDKPHRGIEPALGWNLVPIPNHDYLESLPCSTAVEAKGENPDSKRVLKESKQSFGIDVSETGLRATITFDSVSYMLIKSTTSDTEGVPIFQRSHFQVSDLTTAAEINGETVSNASETQLDLGIIIQNVKLIIETIMEEEFGRSLELKKVMISVPPYFDVFQIQQIIDSTHAIDMNSKSVRILSQSTAIALDLVKQLPKPENKSGNVLTILQHSDNIDFDLLSFSTNDSDKVTIRPVENYRSEQLSTFIKQLGESGVMPETNEILDCVSNHVSAILKNLSDPQLFVLSHCGDETFSEIAHAAVSSVGGGMSSRVFKLDEFASTRGLATVGKLGFWKSKKRDDERWVDVSDDRFMKYNCDSNRDTSDEICRQEGGTVVAEENVGDDCSNSSTESQPERQTRNCRERKRKILGDDGMIYYY